MKPSRIINGIMTFSILLYAVICFFVKKEMEVSVAFIGMIFFAFLIKDDKD